MAKKHHKKNPFRHHRRNPFPETLPNLGKLVLSAAAGGLTSAYLPNLALGAKDTGVLGYLANAAVAGIPPLFLGKWPKLALGWLLGGATMLFGRIIDDYTGQNYIMYQYPGTSTGVGSFFAPGTYPLPAPSVFSPYARGQRALPAAPAVAAAPVAGKGMGWIRSFGA